MGNPLVSVIVPVYNVEEYLKDCLDSISRQSYSNIEIIAVDDGSYDSSGTVCDDYSRSEGRLRVFHQENKGVVSARNEGILRARGEYICFVDADDKIDEYMIEHMLDAIGSMDLATCGVKRERRDGSVQVLKDAFPEGGYSTPAELDYIFDNMIRFNGEHIEGLLPYVWGKLYKTANLSVVAEKLNQQITYAEDRELVYRYMLAVKSVSISHELLYEYKYRPGSALRGASSKVLHDLNYLYTSLYSAFGTSKRRSVLLPQLEMLISARIVMAPSFMGFSPRVEPIRYLFPYYNFFHGEKVVLYGAGRVGWNYWHQTYHLREIDYVLWVDKSYRSAEVQGVEAIFEAKYDYVLIAVLEENVAESIKHELETRGVPREKLLWRKPTLLYDY